MNTPSPNPTKPLILVVDDEPQIQRFLDHALAASGYDTCFAATGQGALEAVATRKPDAMILDLGLPDLNGKEVIETLRAKSNLPIIVFSLDEPGGFRGILSGRGTYTTVKG